MGEAGYWRAVWHVPEHGAEGFRQQMEHLQGDEFLGANRWPDIKSCEERARADVEYFKEMGASIRYLRAQFFRQEKRS